MSTVMLKKKRENLYEIIYLKLFSVHGVIVSVAKVVHIYGMTKSIVVNRRRRIKRRGRTWLINVRVRVFFSWIIAAERCDIIIGNRFERNGTMRSMVTDASVAAVFIGVRTGRFRSMRSTIRGGAIRHVNFDRVITWRRFFLIVNMIRVLIEKSIGGFSEGTGHAVIKYLKKIPK